MIVKGQLTEAQFQVVSGITQRDALTGRIGMVVYVADRNATYIYTAEEGGRWRTLYRPNRPPAPLGQIVQSTLDDGAFTSANGSEWCLCDGRSVLNSDYHTVFNKTNVPDLGGVFLRGKNTPNSQLDPLNTALEGYQVDNKAEVTFPTDTNVIDEIRAVKTSGANATVPPAGFVPLQGQTSSPTFTDVDIVGDGTDWQLYEKRRTTNTTLYAGNTETAPKSITVNFFIRIYRDLAL